MKKRLLVPLALALAVSGLSWLPTAQSAEFPETLLATVPVGADRMDLPTLSRSPAGGLRTGREPARTREPEVCAPFWFTAVAVTWQQDNRRQVWTDIRVGDGEGAWTDAGSLPSNPDDTPDRGSEGWRPSQQGTAMLWTGGSRCIRFAIQMPPETEISDVRVQFINSSGTAEGPGTAPPSPEPAMGTASAATVEPDIIMRDEWGAPSKPRCGPYYADEVKMAFVHHTDGVNRYAKSASDDILRAITAYHVQGRHWCDIAYNFLIDRYGRLFEGRAGGIEEPVISGATQGVNTGSVSVALMGSYTRVAPTAPELAMLKRFLAWRLDVAHVDPAIKTSMTSAGGDNTWVDAGQTVRLHTISGHRDTGYTDCPGGRVYRKLRAIRRAVSRMGLPKIYAPEAWPAAPGTPPWTVAAKGSTSLDWEVDIAPEGGSTIRTLTYSGDRLKVKWDGLDGLGAEAPPGRYLATIEASSADGNARPAVITLRIKAEPSPSPSPSASPSPPPTP